MGTQLCDRSMNRTLFLRTLGIELSRRTLSERNSKDLTRLHTPNHGGHKLLETLGTEEERKEARRMESCYLKLVFQEEEDWVMRMITKHLAANRIIMFKENWRSQKNKANKKNRRVLVFDWNWCNTIKSYITLYTIQFQLWKFPKAVQR